MSFRGKGHKYDFGGIKLGMEIMDCNTEMRKLDLNSYLGLFINFL